MGLGVRVERKVRSGWNGRGGDGVTEGRGRVGRGGVVVVVGWVVAVVGVGVGRGVGVRRRRLPLFLLLVGSFLFLSVVAGFGR